MDENGSKKKIGLVILSLCLIGIVAIGISYAWWRFTAIQDKTNVGISKCFELELSNESDAINLTNTYPITDEEGRKLTPYTFTLTNTCTLSAEYKLNMEMLEGTTLNSKYVAVMVNNGAIKLLSTYDESTTSIDGSTESRTLDTGILGPNGSKDYSVSLWMDKSVTLEDDVQNKVFKSKIVVNAEATNKEILKDKIVQLAHSDTVNLATDDPDNNIRYIGADPSNYVYFNCSDYTNQSDSTCEKWRIIGLFNNITKSDGTKENLIKIIRDDSLGSLSWDYKKAGVGSSTYDWGSNDWSDSQLMMMLNPTNYLKSGYTNSSDIISLGSQQLYSKMGSYYNGTKGCRPAEVASGASFNCTEADFTSTGLKNDTTRNAIEEVVWNLGGTGSYTSASTGLASHWYGYERGTTVYTGRPTTWTGKIGLMYPSDYGYATSGGTTKDRAACLAKELYNWASSDFSDCKGNDYLLYANNHQWTLVPSSASADDVFGVSTGGFVYGTYAGSTFAVRPALFLKSNIQVDKGTGAKSDPYQLKMQ